MIHHAVRRLDEELVASPAGTRKALGDDLEVMDQRLHLGLHLVHGSGQDNLRSVGDDASLQCMPSQRLAKRGIVIFTDSRISCMRRIIPGPYVALPARDRHLELKLLVARVRHVAPHVEVDTGRAQREAR